METRTGPGTHSGDPDPYGVTDQWQFSPGLHGPHLAKSRSHSFQSTGKPFSAMM